MTIPKPKAILGCIKIYYMSIIVNIDKKEQVKWIEKLTQDKWVSKLREWTFKNRIIKYRNQITMKNSSEQL